MLILIALLGCRHPGEPITIRYVGSSTVADFVRDAELVYGRARFEIEDTFESEGWEEAILARSVDLAGVARNLELKVLRDGITSRRIGRDAIAVIVNDANRLAGLTLSQLRDVFTGRVRNWKDLGWRDLDIQPCIVAPPSDTSAVFRCKVLQESDYAACRAVKADRDIIDTVAGNPGAIGHISFSFLKESSGSRGVKALSVDGEQPEVTNLNYPITTSLYFLFREGGEPGVGEFVNWTQTQAGQQVVMRRFVGIGVHKVVSPKPPRREEEGTLIVYTETFPYYDGGISYYPRRSYEILTSYGGFIRRVRNHRGWNDERPMRVRLRPGTYLIRPESYRRPRTDHFVKIESGRTTELHVPARFPAE